MNKQEAVLQIMGIKAVLPEHLQIKLIEAVKVLANFKMINVKDDMPYNHSHLITQLGSCTFGPLCIVGYENGSFRLDNMRINGDGCWTWNWHSIYEKKYGKIIDWLPTRALYGSQIMDELGNELKFE